MAASVVVGVTASVVVGVTASVVVDVGGGVDVVEVGWSCAVVVAGRVTVVATTEPPSSPAFAAAESDPVSEPEHADRIRRSETTRTPYRNISNPFSKKQSDQFRPDPDLQR